MALKHIPWKTCGVVFGQLWRGLTKVLRQYVGPALLVLANTLWKGFIFSLRFAILRYGAVTLTLVMVLLSLLALIPISHNFEGNLTVESLNFTIKQSETRFLSGIRNIAQLRIAGPQVLTLEGQVTPIPSASPILLRTPLHIELSDPQSSVTLRNSETAPNALELTELILQSPSQTEEFRYSKATNRLVLTLSPASNSAATDSAHTLQLTTSSSPLVLDIKGYKDIPELKIAAASTPLKLQYEPSSSTLRWPLPTNAKLDITLNESATWPDSSRYWIWGDLAVSNVEFERQDPRYGIKESTILDGSIRMARQSVEVHPGQFISTGQNSICRIRQLQVNPDGTLSVRFAGRSSRIQVGLDPRFPVETLRVSFLSRWLPGEAVIALVAFCSAIAAALLPQLLQPSEPH